MKKATRMLSFLLVLTLLVGSLPVMTFAAATKEKDIGDLPDTAQNVVYLSDLVYVESTNLDNAEAIRDGAWKTGTIKLGSSNTTFTKGLGVMPQNPDGNGSYGKSWTTFDVSGLKCNNFYGVVGITNGYGKKLSSGQSETVTDANGKETTHKVVGTGIVFEVYAKYDEQSEWVMLEDSGTITYANTYEFHVNITGVKLLKLVVRCNEDIKNYHGYMNCAWGGACVYADGYTPNATIYGDSGVAIVPEVANVHNTYDTVPSSGVTYLNYGSERLLKVEDYDDKLAESGVKIGGLAASTSDTSNAVTFAKGKVVRLTARAAKNTDADNNVDGYAIYNVSGLGNTFYAAVGITNGTGRYSDYNSSNGGYGGVIFEVYGSTDTDYTTAEFTLLAQSEVIYKCNTGEFNVDITGMNLIKLLVRANAGNNASTDSVFGNACVYTADKFDVSYSNMVLGNDLAMHFAFKKDSVADWTGHYAKINYGGEDQIVNFDGGDWNTTTIDGKAYYYVTYSGIAAKEMAETVSVTIYDGNDQAVSNVYTDTVQDYCLRKLMDQSATNELRGVIVDLLNYGAAAQTHFDYNTTDPANDILIAKYQDLAGTCDFYADNRSVEINKAYPNCTYYNTNVALESNIRMKFAFTGLTQNMKAVVTYTNHRGVEKTVEIPYAEFSTDEDAPNCKIIVLDELAVADCREHVTVTIMDGEITVATLTDRVSGYLARKAESEDSAVFSALMTLSDSAYTYFHPDTDREVELLSSHQVIVTDIENGRIIVADLDKEDPFAEENLIWNWTPTTANGWSIKQSELAGSLSSVKYRWSEQLQKNVVLFTDSGGTIGVIEYSTGKRLWEYNLNNYYSNMTATDAAGNTVKAYPGPHAIELLPNGDIVVASSGNGYWENGTLTYLDMSYTSIGFHYIKAYSFALNGAHGVTWDPENELLWALGFPVLEAYELSTTGNYVTLSKVDGKGAAIPNGHGHDLMQDYSDPDILWITDQPGIYQFSKSQNAILNAYPNSDAIGTKTAVKGITSFADGVIALAAGGNSQTIQTYWPQADGTYQLLEYTDADYGFNKVRVFTTDYQ